MTLIHKFIPRLRLPNAGTQVHFHFSKPRVSCAAGARAPMSGAVGEMRKRAGRKIMRAIWSSLFCLSNRDGVSAHEGGTGLEVIHQGFVLELAIEAAGVA